MSNYPKKYFRFSGSALGVSAQFTELDGVQGLNHVIPTLGASVLAATGGVAQATVKNYAYTVDQPRKRTLLSVRRVDTATHGRDHSGDADKPHYETEVESDVQDLQVVDKLNISHLHLNFLSKRKAHASDAVTEVTTKGSLIDGLQMGNVTAKIILDEEPLLYTGDSEQLSAFYAKQTEDYRMKNGWRFQFDPESDGKCKCCRRHKFSLVREIILSGPESEKQKITVDGYTIHWSGFGRIILGEVHVQGRERRVALVRLAMGCNAGGPGTAGSGGSNGHASGD
jgi:hypothetical protein